MFLCNCAFKQDNLELQRYKNAFIIIIIKERVWMIRIQADSDHPDTVNAEETGLPSTYTYLYIYIHIYGI